MTRKVFLVLLALVLALSVGLAACGEDGDEEVPCPPKPPGPDGEGFFDQPDVYHSDIWGWDNPRSVRDEEFAEELYDALHDQGGNADFHSLIITICTCGGGGLMDDVADKFQDSGKPISMTSGAAYFNSQYVTGWRNAGEYGGCDWGVAYTSVHQGIGPDGANLNPAESEAYDETQDRWRWKMRFGGTAQRKTVDNGGNIVLGDGAGGSGAESYHAILFAGDIREYHNGNVTRWTNCVWDDIARHHQMLVRSGYPAENIVVLYGDGNVPMNTGQSAYGYFFPVQWAPLEFLHETVREGTTVELLEAIGELKGKMNDGEQLYIYIGGHGSFDVKPQDDQPVTVDPDSGEGESEDHNFWFAPLWCEDCLVEALGGENWGPYIELHVTSDGSITSNWEVLVNGFDWAVNGGDNAFPSGAGQEASLWFEVDAEAIDVDEAFYVALRNSESGDAPIDVEIWFGIGGIGGIARVEDGWAVPVLAFVDPNLEAAIRETIDEWDDPIYVWDVSELLSLDAADRSIFDLTGLEYAHDLEELDLSDNEISDIMPLVCNPGLGTGDSVDLSGNPLSSESMEIYIPQLLESGVSISY